MGRRRYAGRYTRPQEEPPRPRPFPDYKPEFQTSVLPQPPDLQFIPHDANVILEGSDSASVELDTLRGILAYSTTRNPCVELTAYEQDYPPVPEVSYPPPPKKPNTTILPESELPRPPQLTDFLPAPVGVFAKVRLLDALRRALLTPVAQSQLAAALIKHNAAYPQAEAELTRIRNYNNWERAQLHIYEAARDQWQALNDHHRKLNADTAAEWEAARREFAALKAADISKVGRISETYRQKDPAAIALHAEMVLRRSPYPAVFPRSIEAAYDAETKIVVIDYQLPDIEAIPIVKPKASKVWGTDRVAANATERRQVSDDLLYMIMLRSLREVVLADDIGAIAAVVLNGWMSFKDKATGQQRSEYLMSLHANAEQVLAIDFANVDPKTCFRSLKGVAAPRPSQCVPIAPIMKFDKTDRRIIAGRQVIDGLTAESNLAVMPWDDFEHLIREVFEKEFAHNGAEVRVTQASHDRGVDALVFDPDPVRGGKYVIQAKRYTITVDVSSVRDLYGTVLNEGANRGILVTTSAYGPDAYEFAKDKPITLIDGARLLHLLGKHGYQFRIDLKEARRLFATLPDPVRRPSVTAPESPE